MIDPKLLRGSLDTIILKLLSEHHEMYGYEIAQKVKEISSDEILLTDGSLYPALHRLEGKGTLISESRSIGKRMRKYYKLAEEGEVELIKRLDAMDKFIANMQLILNSKIA